MIENITNVSALSTTRGLASSIGTSSMSESALATGENTGANFASVLGSMATDAMNNLKTAESKSFEGIQGTASTREVVDAVLEAQQSLNTAIALRDKIVNAYLEITKMPI